MLTPTVEAFATRPRTDKQLSGDKRSGTACACTEQKIANTSRPTRPTIKVPVGSQREQHGRISEALHGPLGFNKLYEVLFSDVGEPNTPTGKIITRTICYKALYFQLY